MPQNRGKNFRGRPASVNRICFSKFFSLVWNANLSIVAKNNNKGRQTRIFFVKSYSQRIFQNFVTEKSSPFDLPPMLFFALRWLHFVLKVLLNELKKKTSPSQSSVDHIAFSLRSGRETRRYAIRSLQSLIQIDFSRKKFVGCLKFLQLWKINFA